VMLFHLANAALLPLVGQKLAAAHPNEATATMSACIIAAQLVMLAIALLVGRTADTWGRKPLFLAGFAILPIRAVLYILSDNSFWLIGVQVLDGVGAGIFGALTPLVIADIMRGTGRYNLAQGAIATVQGIGASLSGLAGGVIVDHFGYSAAFLAAGGAAFVALVVFALRMPEMPIGRRRSHKISFRQLPRSGTVCELPPARGKPDFESLQGAPPHHPGRRLLRVSRLPEWFRPARFQKAELFGGSNV
jgi:MFS family permease